MSISPVLETAAAPALVTPNSVASRRTMLKLALASAGGVAIAAWSASTSATTAHAAVDTRNSLVLGAYRPDATTTGVLPGSTLTIVYSHTPVSNTTYTNLDVRCAVDPGSAVGNVVYKNCIFRGPNVAPTGISSLYTMFRLHQRDSPSSTAHSARSSPTIVGSGCRDTASGSSAATRASSWTRSRSSTRTTGPTRCGRRQPPQRPERRRHRAVLLLRVRVLWPVDRHR